MPDQTIMVDDKLFVGRVEEQKQFRAALDEVLDPPPKERLPYVVLLYGDGGTGKTTLAKRFRDIAQREAPYVGKFQVLWLDWEDERKKFPGLQVGREQISPDTVFKVIHATSIRNKWGRQFVAYRKAVSKREEAAKKVAEAITADNDWDELAILRSLSVDALAKIVRTRLPMIGDTGEDIVEAFLEAGITLGADQAAKLRRAIETQLRAHLKPDHYDYFLNPYEQLALALARGLNRVAKNQPMLVVLDSYEIVDRDDIWVRAVTRAAGPQVIWIISGRNDLVESRQFGSEYFKGYADDSPRRLLEYNMLPLAIEDIRTYFEYNAPEHELDDTEIEAISRVTRGIPLAVKEAADILKAGVSLEEIVGDGHDLYGSGQIVQKMTDRYMQHVVAESDKQALFALALAGGDVDLLRAMLQPSDGGTFDLEELLRRLERDYASVHADRARLHDDPAVFFREFLQAEVRRTSDRVKELNLRAVEALKERLATHEAELPLIESRCQDDYWAKAALDLTHYLFWVDETQAWHWAVPRYVEAMAYNRDLLNGLVEIIGEWKGLSESTERLYGILKAGHEDGQALLKVLTKLDERGWLDGENAAERKAILGLLQGNQQLREGQFSAAQEWYERVEASLPPEGKLLKVQLADAYELLAHRLLWPDDRYNPVYNVTAEEILNRIVTWYPDRNYAWFLKGVNLGAGKQYDEAITALQQAISFNPQHAAAHTALGNIYKALGRHDEARAAFDQALNVDPASASSHGGMGAVLQAMGNSQEAITAYERAIEQDEKYVNARIGLSQMYLLSGRSDEALRILQEAESISPDNAGVQNALGDAYLAAGQTEESVASYQKAIEIDPNCTDAYCGMGNAYQVDGRPESASVAFERAIEMVPT